MSNSLIKALNEIGFVCLDIKGTSMLPLFVEGRDKVCIYKYKDNEPIKKGDIILYKREGETFVLHRVMAVRKNDYVLCGDNHCTLEYGVKKEQILGVAKGYYKYDEYIDFNKSKKYKFYKNTYGNIRVLRKIKHALDKIFK